MRRYVTLLALLVIVGCNPRPMHPSRATATPGATPTSGVPPLHFVGKGSPGRPIHIVQTRGNLTLYEIYARSLEGTQAAGATTSRLHDARVIFFDRNGGKVYATAPIAIVDQKTDKVTLEQRVHTTSSSGLVLDCDTLTVNRGTDELHGEGHVVMTNSQGLHATGDRIDSNLSFTRVRLQ